MDPQLSVDIIVRLLLRDGRHLELPVLRAVCDCHEPPGGLVEKAVLELLDHGCEKELQTVRSPESGLLRLSVVVRPMSHWKYVLVAFPAEISSDGPATSTQAVYGIQVGTDCVGLTETEILNRIRDEFGAGLCDGVKLSAYDEARTPPPAEAAHPCLNSDAPSPREREWTKCAWLACVIEIGEREKN